MKPNTLPSMAKIVHICSFYMRDNRHYTEVSCPFITRVFVAWSWQFGLEMGATSETSFPRVIETDWLYDKFLFLLYLVVGIRQHHIEAP